MSPPVRHPSGLAAGGRAPEIAPRRRPPRRCGASRDPIALVRVTGHGAREEIRASEPVPPALSRPGRGRPRGASRGISMTARARSPDSGAEFEDQPLAIERRLSVGANADPSAEERAPVGERKSELDAGLDRESLPVLDLGGRLEPA